VVMSVVVFLCFVILALSRLWRRTF
jgi:hypothetical protein